MYKEKTAPTAGGHQSCVAVFWCLAVIENVTESKSRAASASPPSPPLFHDPIVPVAVDGPSY